MSWCMIHLPVHVHNHTQTAMLTCWAWDNFALLGFKAKRLSRNWGWRRKRGPEVEWERALESVNFHHPSLWLRHWHTETSPRSLSTNCAGKWFLLSAKSYYPSLHPSLHLSASSMRLSLSLYFVFPSLSLFPFGSVEHHACCLMDSLSLTDTHTHTHTHTNTHASHHVASRGCTWGSLIGISSRDMPFVCNCTGLPQVTGLESVSLKVAIVMLPHSSKHTHKPIHNMLAQWGVSNIDLLLYRYFPK